MTNFYRLIPLLIAGASVFLNQKLQVTVDDGLSFSLMMLALGLLLIYLRSFFAAASKSGGIWYEPGTFIWNIRPQDVPGFLFAVLGYIFLLVAFIPLIGKLTT